MKTFIVCIALFLVPNAALHAQDIEAKLSGNTTAQGFTVKSYAGTPLFTVRADGKIGLGILNPDVFLHVAGQMKITGGSPGAGKVLTSDANGLATWTMLSSLPPSGPAGGDLKGTYPNPTITDNAVTSAKIADGAVTPAKISSTGASSGQVIKYDGTNVVWATPGSGGGSLDQAYDYGGAGAGRTITADAGAVKIQGVDGFLVTSESSSLGAIPASGTGSRMMWYPKKRAFRSGYVVGTQWDDANVGDYSCAIGVNTTASGTSAVALGSNTTASGNRSTALGYETKAESYACTALGRYNVGGGSDVSWVGSDPIFEIGIGPNTVYPANAVTVLKNGRMGLGTAAPDATLHVDGTVKITGGSPGSGKVLTSDATGLASWTAPSGVTLDQAYDQGGAGAGRIITADAGAVVIAGVDGLLVTGESTTQGTIPASGAGARMMWYPKKRAFRVGYAVGTEWDDANIGLYSNAMGANTTASGIYSTAMGRETTADDSYSTAMGYGTTASEDYSTAMGYSTTASGNSSTAMGSNTTASGGYSISMGINTTASGDQSTAMGAHTTASGLRSTAMGSYASTGGQTGSMAIGDNSTTNVLTNTAANQWRVRFAGGIGFYTNALTTTGVYMNAGTSGWTNYCDRNKKENFSAIDGEVILARLRAVPVSEWNYKGTETSVRYIGPMAQDFWQAFHLGGTDSLGINSISIDGVNMAAIQALEKRTAKMNEKTADLQRKTAELQQKTDEIASLKEKVATLENALEQHAAQAAELRRLKSDFDTLRAFLMEKTTEMSVKHASLDADK